MNNKDVVMYVLFVISIILNGILTSYWYDNEYPHGTVWHEAKIIYFFNDEFDYHTFVDFEGHVYEIKDNNIENKIYSSFNSWVKVNYSISEIERYGIMETVLTINDSRTFSFEIKYHTYDRLTEGNEIHYMKQKVIDDFRISGWHNAKL